MRVAVTGADGFVGRHLCSYLESAGDDVVAMPGPPPRSNDPSAGFIDVTDEPGLRAALARCAPDAVVHLAGLSAVGRSHEAPVETVRVNTLGAVSLCSAVRSVAPRARILLIGSGEVYGSIADGARATEKDALAPASPYAASKAAAEIAAMQFHRAYGLSVIAARPFNHLGRGQSRDFAIPAFARQLAAMGESGGTLSVGNLDPVRDFSHVDDVCAAYRLLVARGVPGEVYNVASGVGRTIRSVVDELIAVSGVAVRVEVDPGRVRPVDLPRLVGDAAKLSSLGWVPKRSVREALTEALAEAREERLD